MKLCITIVCCTGESSFDVVWLHNEKEIKNSKDFQYQTEGSDYKLVITEIFPEDGGIYTCEAFNDAGEAFSSCTLVVLGELSIDILFCFNWDFWVASNIQYNLKKLYTEKKKKGTEIYYHCPFLSSECNQNQ